MATVYLAEDLRHERKVAIKVLRPELSAVIGAERFVREIKTIAALQHPHILGLIDSGEIHGTAYYVMPYVEGESLRDRLVRERQLPVEEAVRVAAEIAAALDYAHRRGVIHRDIKPENILLHDGSALVADFGIALAVSSAGGTTRMTETGMSLGTPTYMSPEQAMGEREVGPRSDVYALGCVLYEMLAGEPPFTGPTAQAVVARVMTEEPRSLRLQRKSVPPRVEATVMKALEKLPADRFAGAADFADALHGRGPEPASWGSNRFPAPARRSRWVAGAPWALAAAAAALAAWGWLGQADHPEPTWNYVSFGDSLGSGTPIQNLALSPDGRIVALKDGRQDGLIWIKRQDRLEPTPVPGTERGQGVTFSPDGSWLAFVADGSLKKVQLAGGTPITITDSVATEFFNVAWLSDGTLVYSGGDLLRRVSASGGQSSVVMADTLLRGSGLYNIAPLPDARGVLFTSCNSGCVTTSARVLDFRSGRQKVLVDGAYGAWALPGNLLAYLRRDGVVLVAPFDLRRLEITGTAVPVLQNVLALGPVPMLAWSPAGTMIYLEGAGSLDVSLVRVSRDGTAAPVDTGWTAAINSFALSPDGRHLAVGAGLGSGAFSLFVKRLDRGPFSRLTFGAQDRRPAWSPDGRTVGFVRDSVGGGVVYARSADGTGADRLIGRTDRPIQEFAWSGDGRWLVVRTDNGSAGAGDLVGIPLEGDTAPVPLLATAFTELHPAISPDSKWLAYTSNESGSNEVYVRPFPNVGEGRWQVSNGGGFQPVWSPDGTELFYLTTTLRLMAAEVQTTPAFDVIDVRPLLDASGFAIDPFHQAYSVEPGSRSFLFARQQGEAGSRPQAAVLVERWLADVAARVAQ
jgi:serine/threonine-protein kinase